MMRHLMSGPLGSILSGPLGLVGVVAVMWWGITFNSRLEEKYHCTACTFWGVAGGIAGMFCWMIVMGSRFSLEWVIVAVIAVAITLALYTSNRAKSGITKIAILMTVWQMLVGLAVVIILAMIDNSKKKKK